MAKKKRAAKSNRKLSFALSNQQKLVLGSLLLILGILLFIAFLSHFFTGEADQSIQSVFTSREAKAENWLSKIGAWASDLFIYRGFGVASFIFSGLIFISGIYIRLGINKARLGRHWFWGTLIVIWISILFGFLANNNPLLGGTIGFEMNDLLQDYIGKIGTALLLVLGLITYLAIRLKVTAQQFGKLFKSAEKEIKSEFDSEESHEFVPIDNDLTAEADDIKSAFEVQLENLEPTITHHSKAEDSVEIEIEKITKEKSETDNLANKLVEDFGKFDPTLELGNYQFPPLDLLKKYNEDITVNKEELEDNKNRIVETLRNYNIGIKSVKATIGPTVTLYEIIPEAGVRISKIKNLEDDIALSLSALGIRIIAPMPGKGTIGIEVPNKNATIVSMYSVIASQKFQKAEMELPIALGKTISNETFVVDLAKMPHLLMSGATGQGKSVGINAVLASLLYKKHPAEVKFVLVDPKKVELTLFNKIERHYLAKLPDSEEAIITDNTKVINTLNSLCIEMDNRYELLKNAFCRNIKEYNTKFKARKLNPNDGHQFLPYIVLVVDEFADLIMTAGK